jgi:hypothetical protein
MLLHLSLSNLLILVTGIVLVVLNAVASSRVAPVLARWFSRLGHKGHRPHHRGA